MATTKKIQVLRLIHDRGNLGRSYVYVSVVTEKVIKTVCNDICERYYDRSDGGIRGIANRSIAKLEKFIAENGKEKERYQSLERWF